MKTRVRVRGGDPMGTPIGENEDGSDVIHDIDPHDELARIAAIRSTEEAKDAEQEKRRRRGRSRGR